MEEQKKLEITLLSGACCNPSLVKTEQDLEKRLLWVVQQLGLDAQVKVVSLSAVLAGKASVDGDQSQMIQAMFQKFGGRVAPAALIGKRFLFAGGAPSTEKLTGMLQAEQPAEKPR